MPFSGRASLYTATTFLYLNTKASSLISLTSDRRARSDNIFDPHAVDSEALELDAVLPSALAGIVRHEEGALAGTPQGLHGIHCCRFASWYGGINLINT